MPDSGFITAVFETPLLRNALIAGGLSGICCACLSPLVVLRRMAFIGDGMAHAAFGGMGLSVIIFTDAHYDDLPIRLGTIAFSLLLGLALGAASRRSDVSKIAEDSVIGIAFSVSMALGSLLIAIRQRAKPQYVPAMDSYLFGSVLNIGTLDMLMLAGLAAVVVVLLILFYKEILFYTYDARLAELSGVKVGYIHYAFILMLVLTVVISSRVIGIILVSSSLVIPGVIALKLCKRLNAAMATAGLLGFFSFEAGACLSYFQNVPPGSAIILIQFTLLLLTLATERRAPAPER